MSSFVGSLISGLTEKKVHAPDFVPIDYDKVLRGNLAGNKALLPDSEKLGSDINDHNQGELLKLLGRAAPFADTLINKGEKNIEDWLGGVIPQDVQDAINRSSAYKSQSGGYGGSGMARNLDARDLGLTSLDLQSKGTAAALPFLSGVAALKMPNRFDVTSQFGNIGQRLETERYNNEGKWNRAYLENQLRSKPDAWISGLSDTLGAIENTVGSFGLGGILGGLGGGTGSLLGNQVGVGGYLGKGNKTFSVPDGYWNQFSNRS